MKIVIVEDELRQRRGIVSIIKAIDPAHDCIVFEDGPEALMYLSQPQNSADLLLTDVSMPEMDGLTLIKALRRLDITLPTVIISGYAQFAYAQEAITLGAYGYLLKPVNPQEISDMLIKLKQQFARQQALQTEQARKERQLAVSLPVYLERQMNKWLRGELSAASQQEITSLFPFDGAGCMLLLSFAAPPTQDLFTSLHETLRPIAHTYAFRVEHDAPLALAVALMKPGRQAHELIGAVDAWRRMDCIASNGQMQIYIGTEAAHAVRQVPALFQKELAQMRYAAYMTPDSVLLLPCGAPSGTEPLAAALFWDLLINQPRETARELTERLLDTLAKDHMASIDGFKEAVRKACEMIFRKAQACLDEETARLFLKELAQIIQEDGSFPLLKAHLAAFWIDVAQIVSGSSTSRQQAFLRQYRRYMERNYMKDLSQSGAAAHFGLSVGYFSNLVNQLTGKSFPAYLKALRIEKTRALLLEKDLLVQEVAEMVGYHDISYFNRVFKKDVGMTPEQFRKRGTRA